MKKYLVTAVLIGLLSCNKEKREVKSNETPTVNALNLNEGKSYSYIAEDGSRAKLSFQNEDEQPTITIEANNTKYVLDKKDADPDAEIYERNGVQAKLTKDSLIIMQGDLTIPLALEK